MTPLPVFPLNTVLYPGMVLPLHVFEDRYRAMIRDLRGITDPAERIFVVPAIREGYEVGDHGVQSMHRVGTLVQLNEVTSRDDGTLDVQVTGRHRVRIDELFPDGEYLRAQVVELPDVDEPDAQLFASQATSLFTRYSAAVQQLTGVLIDPTNAPEDPAYLSYWMAAVCPLAMHQRQQLLECDSASERLGLLQQLLHREISSMSVIPSLPATELARTRWSPN